MLRTERLVLRWPGETDASRLALLANEYDIARFTTLPHPYSEQDARSFIEKARRERGERSSLAFAITLDGGLIGMVSLMNIEPYRAELGYWLGKPYWRHGYMGEAAQRIVRFGFEDLELVRIWGQVMAENTASIRLLESLGFTLEGTLRQHEERFGERHDMHLYGLVKEKKWDSEPGFPLEEQYRRERRAS